MSLKYRDSQGNETPVAGLNGTSGELVPSVALMKSGVANVSMPNTSSLDQLFTVQVTFDTPFEDANYVLNVDQCEVSEAEINRVFDKTASGFYIAVMYNRQRTTVPSYNVTARIPWQAFKLMTDESRALDETHIAQNTANFASAFSEVTSYAVGDYVTYNNILYRCTTAHTAGVWVAGHFTQVTVGGTLGEIVPSNATSSNKLVPVSDTIINYTPATSYNSWDEFLEMLHQKGPGMWCGKAYLGTQWWSYYVSIQVGNAGYWLGNGIFKGSDSTQLIGVNKSYSIGTTWTITEYNRAPYAFNSNTAHIVATLPNNSLYRVTVDKHMQNTEMGVFLIGIYGTTSITLLKEAESTAGKFTISHTAANTVEITDTDGGHIWAKFEYLGGYS